MRQCDVAVVGLGLIGSAALDALMRRGVDALGFDPRGPGAEQGSSHGSCRIFRRFNFENSNYTGLSDEALQGWARLARESGAELLIPGQSWKRVRQAATWSPPRDGRRGTTAGRRLC